MKKSTKCAICGLLVKIRKFSDYAKIKKCIAVVRTILCIWDMTKSANLYARIEPEVKEEAESILAALGIPVSNAINMFYKQIILQQGPPFDVK